MFTATRSGFPSPFNSTITTETGFLPVSNDRKGAEKRGAAHEVAAFGAKLTSVRRVSEASRTMRRITARRKTNLGRSVIMRGGPCRARKVSHQGAADLNRGRPGAPQADP